MKVKTPPTRAAPVRMTKDRALYQKIKKCGSKRPYATEEAALAQIEPNMMVYQCSHCSQWHRATKLGFRALPGREEQPGGPPYAARKSARDVYGLNLSRPIYNAFLDTILAGRGQPVDRVSNQRTWLAVNYNNARYVVLYNNQRKCIERFGAIPLN